MGVFSALVGAQRLPLVVVLAFGPQQSVTAGGVAGETRWSAALQGDRRRLLRIAAGSGGLLRQRLPYG